MKGLTNKPLLEDIKTLLQAIKTALCNKPSTQRWCKPIGT